MNPLNACLQLFVHVVNLSHFLFNVDFFDNKPLASAFLLFKLSLQVGKSLLKTSQ